MRAQATLVAALLLCLLGAAAAAPASRLFLNREEYVPAGRRGGPRKVYFAEGERPAGVKGGRAQPLRQMVGRPHTRMSYVSLTRPQPPHFLLAPINCRSQAADGG